MAITETPTPLTPNISSQRNGKPVSSRFDSMLLVSDLTCTVVGSSYYQ